MDWLLGTPWLFTGYYVVPLVASICGALLAHLFLRRSARSRLALLGVLLSGYAGWWLLAVLSLYPALKDAVAGSAAFYHFLLVGVPSLAALLAILRGYKCAIGKALAATLLFFAGAAISFSLLAVILPSDF